jgi:protease I
MLLALALGQVPLAPVKTASDRPAGPDNSVLVFVPQALFHNDEFEGVTRTLARAGLHVRITAADTGVAVGMNRMIVLPDLPLAETRVDDYSGLVIVGGSGAILAWDDSLLLERCRQFAAAGKVVAAIGVAPIILARAGVLKDRRATVFFDRHAVEELRKAGARYRFRPLERDGRLVTAAGVEQVRDFARTVAGLIAPARAEGKR